ncbi:cytochrome b-c1 complex subunit Rieske, mitochondrial-like [Ruditapes philippinarum]|uniref:cytochrome b-c1 complex subunit Rieske, mitochondrial-like n=1 Tax=Ruditapes philippinarum TaxID=129788 RepID=UPI00295A5F2C|nr:cytochrome b-c1 complex subunit Rieske, mitochondrial-like [Ruditapes philippinarum]
MISIPKSAGVTAVSQIVNCTKTSAAPVILKKHLYKRNVFLPTKKHTLPSSGIAAFVEIGGPCQVRFSHTDVKFPDYDVYRKKGNIDKHDVNRSETPSRTFSYVMAGAGALGGIYMGKTIVERVVTSLATTKDVLALSKVEINLSEIPEGKNMVFKWRGKPLFVRHRTSEEIETEQNVNLAELRDPQHDSDRVQDPKWLVCLGICTHLGCVPVADAGDFGGYYCPCHGSHYDAAGRIRKGPAPLNLEVPFYQFEDQLLIVG